MDADPVRAVTAHLEAFNRSDADALAAGFHEHAVFATGNDVTIEGREPLRNFFAEAFQGVELSLTTAELVSQGPIVAAQMVERIVIDGQEEHDHIAAFYRVEDGLLRSVKVYREGSATR